MRAFLLAAGHGERLRPITERCAKPALDFLNVPMLAFPLKALEERGLRQLVINTHHLPEAIHQACARISHPDYRIEFSHESPEILGSAGGLAQAAKHFAGSEHFWFVNGDAVSLFDRSDPLSEMWQRHVNSDALATILVCSLSGVGDRFGGVWVGTKGQVIGFGKEAPDSDAQGLHFTGFIAFSERILSLVQARPSNILYDVLGPLIARGERVNAYIDSGITWFETGSQKDYLSSTHECLKLLAQQGERSRYLERILRRYSPGWDNYKNGNIWSFSKQNLLKSSTVAHGLIARGAQIGADARFENFAVVGEGCVIEAKARINSAVLLRQTRAGAQLAIENQIVI